MRHEVQVKLLETALARIRRRDGDTGDEIRRTPVENYISAERLAEERRVLFRRFPLVVGFSSQVARPGQFLTHDLTEVPILVSRDREGGLRAFINACRHRGTRLVDEACGEGRKSFVCPYHAWTYDLGGRLRGIPHEAGFPGVARAERGLVELPVDERHGLIFVLPTPGMPRDIDRYLGPLFEDLEGFGFADHILYAPSRRTRDMNWKLMMDTSYETYHFRKLHAKTIYSMFFDNTGVFHWEPPHARMLLPKRSILEIEGTDSDSWRVREHANIIYGIFPNTLVLVQPDHAMVISAWPASTDRTVISGGMLIPAEPQSESAERHWRNNEEIFWAAIEEDIAAGESIQSTLRSGANEELLLGRFEHLIARYHEAVERALATAPR
jgi:phenylpropionate dioxygenase-like ring-hydroxylating dioxygenase large terminal subunit